MLFFRWLFIAAAAYNFAFGGWAALFPYHFFSLFDLPPPRYPSIWACVGMVVGLYGIVYLHVARYLEDGDLFVWIGLIGKMLGPIGWLHAIWTGELRPRTFPLILANDLIWWFPFLFYLLRRSPWRRAIIARFSVAIHVVACLSLLAVSGGTEIEPAPAARARWVAENSAAWAATWFFWSLASISLLAFVVVWSQRLLELSAPRAWVIGGSLVCAVGVAFDLCGETIYIAHSTKPALTLEGFVDSVRAYRLLSVATANGLYCLAGLVLSGISWRIGFVQGRLGVLGYVMWLIGLVLTAMALLDNRLGQVVTGGALMVLYIIWASVMSGRLDPTGSTH